jgi:hypothetical protein
MASYTMINLAKQLTALLLKSDAHRCPVCDCLIEREHGRIRRRQIVHDHLGRDCLTTEDIDAQRRGLEYRRRDG